MREWGYKMLFGERFGVVTIIWQRVERGRRKRLAPERELLVSILVGWYLME